MEQIKEFESSKALELPENRSRLEMKHYSDLLGEMQLIQKQLESGQLDVRLYRPSSSMHE